VLAVIRKRFVLSLTVAALAATVFVPGSAGANGDTTAPSVALGSPGLTQYTTSRWIPVRWAGLDESGIAGFDVEVRVMRWNGDDTGWRPWLTGTTATARAYTGLFGRSYCFRVRAHDTVGNTSIFTVPGCVAVPLHSGHMIYGGGWLKSASSESFAGQFAWSTRNGAAVFRTSVRGERLALIVSRCPTCGSVRVYWNGVPMKNVSLTATTVQRSVVIPIADWGWLRSGDLVIQVRSASPRLVALEGLGVFRD